MGDPASAAKAAGGPGAPSEGALGRARRVAREGGVWPLALAALRRIGPEWVLFADHEKVMLLDEAPAIPSLLARLPIRELGVEDIPLLEKLRPAGRAHAEGFERGRRVLACLPRGEIAGAVWLWPRRRIDYPRWNLRLELKPETCWSHFVYVAPRFRALGVFPRLWHAAYAEALAAGYSRLACTIGVDNARSLDAHGALGWREVGELVALRLAGLRLTLSREEGRGWRPGLGFRRWRV